MQESYTCEFLETDFVTVVGRKLILKNIFFAEDTKYIWGKAKKYVIFFARKLPRNLCQRVATALYKFLGRSLFCISPPLRSPKNWRAFELCLHI